MFLLLFETLKRLPWRLQRVPYTRCVYTVKSTTLAVISMSGLLDDRLSVFRFKGDCIYRTITQIFSSSKLKTYHHQKVRFGLKVDFNFHFRLPYEKVKLDRKNQRSFFSDW